MKMNKPTLVAVVLSFSAFGLAQEKKIQREELPPAVEKSLQQKLDGATVKAFNTEKEHGKVVYEAELIVNGHTKDIQFDPNGNVMEVEEEVTMESLPAEVKAGLMAKAQGGTIAKVESLKKKDKLVAYEAQVQKSGKRSEIQVGPSGEKLNHEE